MIEFKVYLKEENWEPAMGGWRCDALLIPGAKFESLYHDGMKATEGDFYIENSTIIWRRANPKPRYLLVTLSLAKDLPKLEEEKLQLEREKFNLEQQLERDKLKLEQQKASVETRWKITTAVGAILGSLLTFGTTYVLGSSKLATSVTTPPRVHTYATVMSIPEDRCIDSITKSLENYGLQSVTPVRTGVYATKGSYNVFVGCNLDVKAVFLAVSGPDDSDAKRLREDIKALLP